MTASTSVMARTEAAQPALGSQVAFRSLGGLDQQMSSAEAALQTFIAAMASGDAGKVWSLAGEEDQDAFPTAKALLAAYNEAFPQLRAARSASVISARADGDTPMLTVAVSDANGSRWTAEMGVWKSDAGDWTMVSCDIEPASTDVPMAQNAPDQAAPAAQASRASST